MQSVTATWRRAGSALFSCAAATLTITAALACGSPSSANAPSDGGPQPTRVLDCAWGMADNCWKSTVAGAKDCLPPYDPHGATGTLNADATACTYPTGQTVTFARSLVQHGEILTPSFTVTNAGKFCAKYGQLPNGMTLTTASGSVTCTWDQAETTVTCVCADGTTASGPLEPLNSCKPVPIGLGRGSAASVSDAGVLTGSVSADFQGSYDGDTSAFYCQTP